jgi:hypothetical protein
MEIDFGRILDLENQHIMVMAGDQTDPSQGLFGIVL